MQTLVQVAQPGHEVARAERDAVRIAPAGDVRRDRIDVGPLVSEVLPLSDGPSAFKRLLDGKENLLKIVLEP